MNAPAYYNTNQEKGSGLKKAQAQAKRQKAVVLAFFQSNPGQYFSPDMGHQRVLPRAPITSVRRSMTNLTIENRLEKTPFTVIGPWGKKVHTWRLNNNPVQAQGGMF